MVSDVENEEVIDQRVRTPLVLVLALLLISYDLGQMIQSVGYLVCKLRVLVYTLGQWLSTRSLS